MPAMRQHLMRTTLTLEPDVVALLKARMERERISLKRAVNDALRRGLSKKSIRREKAAKVHVPSWRLGLRPGVDPTKLGQLLDQMAIDAFAERLASSVHLDRDKNAGH